MENVKDQPNEKPELRLRAVRRSAYFWWGKLDNDIKVKYASECLDKKGKVLKYNNDGYMMGIDFNDIIGMFQHYA